MGRASLGLEVWWHEIIPSSECVSSLRRIGVVNGGGAESSAICGRFRARSLCFSQSTSFGNGKRLPRRQVRFPLEARNALLWRRYRAYRVWKCLCGKGRPWRERELGRVGSQGLQDQGRGCCVTG